jgi:hypothetical protein
VYRSPSQELGQGIACIPIDVDFVVLLEYADEMFNVVLVGVFHSEVFNNKGKADGSPVVTPVSWGDCTLPVSSLLEALGEEVLCKYTSLGEAIHPTLHFTEDVAICVYFVAEFVFIDDVLGEQI